MTNVDTRERLLDAAEKVFARAGFDAATVKDIADEADLNISLISYHFHGKEGLYMACMERFGAEGMQLIQKILSPADSIADLRAKLRLCMDQVVDCHVDDENACRIMHMEVINGLPHCKEVFRDTFHQAFLHLVKFLEQAKKKKLVRENLQSETIAKIIFGSLMHFAQSDSLSKEFFNKSISDPKHRKRIIDDCLAIILDGIAE